VSASTKTSKFRAIAFAAILASFTWTYASAQDANTAEAAPVITQNELAAKIQESSNNLRAEISSVAGTVRSTRDGLESKIDERAAVTQKSISDLRSTVQISALATTLVSAACAIISLLVLFRISHIAGNVVALQNMPVIPQMPQSSGGQNPSVTLALSRIEEKLNAMSKASFAKPMPEPANAPREITDRLAAIEQTLQNLAARKENSAGTNGMPDATAAFWPKSVQNAENFPIWKKQLRNALAAEDDQAMLLTCALLDFQIQSSKRDIDAERYAELAHSLGMAAYGFCYSQEKVAEEDRLDIASALFRAVKDDAQIHAIPIEIRACVPNDRLNTDTMEKVDSGSRLTVQRPLSWIIVDKSGGKERILYRAKVITG
jgi:hypothetical protein